MLQLGLEGILTSQKHVLLNRWWRFISANMHRT